MPYIYLVRRPTFTSLKVFAAVNLTAMGKNADGSAGGTTNSMDPLSTTIHKSNQSIL